MAPPSLHKHNYTTQLRYHQSLRHYQPTNQPSEMNQNPIYINSFNKAESTPLWKWKTIDFPQRKPENKLSTVTEFFGESGRKLNDVVLGPGVGAGVGCGVGLGLGVVGGAGFGVSGWNQLTAVFGIGMGCGVGVGLGFGQGFGAGFSLESLKSHFSKRKSKSKRRVVV